MTKYLFAAAVLTLAASNLAFADGLTKIGPDPAPGTNSKATPSAVPTFHCLGLYWSPEGGDASKSVFVKFREPGEKTWRDGLAMRYNPVQSPECKADYRGSIVNLKPNTQYEIALTLEGTSTHATFKAATWNEKFPIASTVKCPSSSSTLKVTKSGTENGYVLYDGTNSTIDTNNKEDLGISVNASYVILRGFTIKNVKQHGIRTFSPSHHVVIEDCDISKWGSEDNEHVGFGIEMNAGVYSKDKDLHNLVVQRCKIHHPTWNSNSWAEDHTPGTKSRHPDGPQTIVMWECEGNNVIRYNELWSDDKHYFNDVIGGAFNGSYRGWPGRDSDIYGNYIANCWDDGIEVEGGGQNLRIWNNYIENTLMSIGNAANSIGPLYIWQNVSGRSYTPPGSEYGFTHGCFMKMGFAGKDIWMGASTYVFNNTLFQGPEDNGPKGLGVDRVIKHTFTRNNILNARASDTHSISTDKRHEDNDFDFDLLSARYPAESEKHGIKGKPIYVKGAGFSSESRTGLFQLAPDSPGYHKAQAIPNFCEGKDLDVGAQQSGTPPMVYGVKAEFVPASPKK